MASYVVMAVIVEISLCLCVLLCCLLSIKSLGFGFGYWSVDGFREKADFLSPVHVLVGWNNTQLSA